MRTDPSSTPGVPEPPKARDWKALLSALAPEGWAQAHPGGLDKLAAFLDAHPGDFALEAGALEYLVQDLKRAERMAFWRKAADALPANPAVCDALVRQAMLMGMPGAELDTLLLTQSGRFPKDHRLPWLRASLAFQEGRNEEGLALLKIASGMPPEEDFTETGQLAACEVREALEGPQPMARTVLQWTEIPLPALGLWLSASRKQVQWTEALRAQGEMAPARELLEAEAALSRRETASSHFLVGAMVGSTLEEKALEDLQDLCTALGDPLGAEATARRLVELASEREAVMEWARHHNNWEACQHAKKLYEGMPNLPEADRWAAVENLLSAEEKAQLKRFNGDELKEYRAWRKAHP